MLENIKLISLRSAEHLNFMNETVAVLRKHHFDNAMFQELVGELIALRDAEETAIAVERGNVLSQQVAAAERYRDQLHGGLYCYVKSFLYDEQEAAPYDAARRVMRIIRQVGNPTRLTDSAETAKLKQLEDELKPYAADIALIDAAGRLEKLSAANRRYAELSAQRREDNQTRPSGNVKTIRLQIDPVYRSLAGAVNLLARKDAARYEPFITEMNGIVAEYNRLLHNRTTKKNNKTGDTPEE